MDEAWIDAAVRSALLALAGFAVTFVAIAILRPVALKIGLLDKPGGRKTHDAPTPVIGGLAIAVGAVPVVLMVSEYSPSLTGLGLAALILLVTGIADDLFDVRWPLRVCAQGAAALVLCYVADVKVEMIGQALGFQQSALGALSTPFTVIATVGIINALNMADGVDGLAGMLTLVAAGMLAAAAVYSGDMTLAIGLVGLMGAMVAFLAFNLRTPWRKRASVFLGNAGSEILGLVIAWASFRLTQNPAHPVSPVLAPFLIAPPVIDCLVLLTRRVRKGVSPFSADRGHMHHLLLDSGLKVPAVALIIPAVSLVIGTLAAFALRSDDIPEPWFIAAFLALTTGYYVISSRWEAASAALSRLSGAAPEAPEPVEVVAPAPVLAERRAPVARRRT